MKTDNKYRDRDRDYLTSRDETSNLLSSSSSSSRYPTSSLLSTSSSMSAGRGRGS
jgi:hypothetical protein